MPRKCHILALTDNQVHPLEHPRTALLLIPVVNTGHFHGHVGRPQIGTYLLRGLETLGIYIPIGNLNGFIYCVVACIRIDILGRFRVFLSIALSIICTSNGSYNCFCTNS